MSTSLVMTVERVKNILSQNGQVIVSEGRNKNNQATVLTVGNGCIINCWDSGKVNTQGKNTVEIDQLLTGKIATPTLNKKVFVVYGHDNNARTQLEAQIFLKSKQAIKGRCPQGIFFLKTSSQNSLQPVTLLLRFQVVVLLNQPEDVQL